MHSRDVESDIAAYFGVVEAHLGEPADPRSVVVAESRPRTSPSSRPRRLAGIAAAVAVVLVGGLALLDRGRRGEDVPSTEQPSPTVDIGSEQIVVEQFVESLRQAATDGDYAAAASMWSGYPYAESERLDRVIEFKDANLWVLDGELTYDVYDAWSPTPDSDHIVAITRTDWAGTAAVLVGRDGRIERLQVPEQITARFDDDRNELTVGTVPVEGGILVYAGGIRLGDDAVHANPASNSTTIDLAGADLTEPLLVVVSTATAEQPGALAFIVDAR